MIEAAAIFYDGLTARRHAVTVFADDFGLTIIAGAVTLACWRYGALRQQDAPIGWLRLSADGAEELARLETTDDTLAEEVLRRCPHLRRAQRAQRTGTARIVGWSMAAALSLILTAIYLVPLAADRLTPFVPLSVERWLGDAVDSQVRALFGAASCSTPAGDAALASLQEKLGAGANLSLPVTLAVLKSPVPNAFALPGGRIYILGGLLDRAASSEEVAGVLAHEIGHAAHRDGLRRLLQSSGSSFLIGLLFGDVLGGGVIVMAGRTLVDSAHSRAAERAADAFAATLLLQLGQSPKTLGAFLARLDKEVGGDSEAFAFLRSHPLSEDRMGALSQSEPARAAKPLLNAAEWQALKAICGIASSPENADRPGPR